MSIRLIVCFDINANTPKEAYSHLEPKLRNLGVAWETSDEWYDNNDEAGDPAELQTAIVKYYRKSPPGT